MTLPRNRIIAIPLVVLLVLSAAPAVAVAAVNSGSQANAAASAGEGHTLESAAKRAADSGRKIAMSLIAVGFAIASIVLAFRRDFKEAAGVFAIGLVAVLLAGEYGVKALQDTVKMLFG